MILDYHSLNHQIILVAIERGICRQVSWNQASLHARPKRVIYGLCIRISQLSISIYIIFLLYYVSLAGITQGPIECRQANSTVFRTLLLYFL